MSLSFCRLRLPLCSGSACSLHSYKRVSLDKLGVSKDHDTSFVNTKPMSLLIMYNMFLYLVMFIELGHGFVYRYGCSSEWLFTCSTGEETAL